MEEQVLLVKDEPIIYYPTELDPTTASPTPDPEGYIPSEEELEQLKQQYVYTTSDTKYILPFEYCTIHTFVETLPPDTPIPFEPFDPSESENPQYPYVPAVLTPTPVPDTTNSFSNGGFQSH